MDMSKWVGFFCVFLGVIGIFKGEGGNSFTTIMIVIGLLLWLLPSRKGKNKK